MVEGSVRSTVQGNHVVRAQAEAERRKRIREKRSSFLSAYFNDRVSFVHDCFNWSHVQSKPVEYQDEILSLIDDHNRVSARGPHGLGKTSLSAWNILHFAITREVALVDWKVPTTASSWKQLTDFLWPEIHKWAKMIRWDRIPLNPFTQRQLLTLNLDLSFGSAFAIASDDATLIEGAHATELLYIFDESKSIKDSIFDAAEGAFSNAGADTNFNAKAFAVSTPGEPLGRFYEIHSRKHGYEDWRPIHVTLERCIKAKRISQEWADARANQWGTGSSLYQNRVEGQFAEETTEGMVPLSWLELSYARWDELHRAGNILDRDVIAIGADIADGGDDDTTIAKLRSGFVIEAIEVVPKTKEDLNLNKATGKLVGYARRYRAPIAIDAIGVGAGVCQRVREVADSEELGIEVISYKSSESTDIMDEAKEQKFFRKRSAAWWKFREYLNPDLPYKISLPRSDRLTKEVMSMSWKEMSGGVIKVRSKEEVKKDIGISTDYADCIIHALWAIVGEETIELIMG